MCLSRGGRNPFLGQFKGFGGPFWAYSVKLGGHYGPEIGDRKAFWPYSKELEAGCDPFWAISRAYQGGPRPLLGPSRGGRNPNLGLSRRFKVHYGPDPADQKAFWHYPKKL